jgi:uncharacterized membrane protein
VNTLTVWRFDGSQAAEEALPRLERLAALSLVSVDDAALVSWPHGRRKPSARGLGSLTGGGGLWAGSWGMLLALIFLVPIAGPAFGAAAGTLAGSLADFGIDDDFIKRVRDAVTPGTSALFLLTSRAGAETLTEELADLDVMLIRCNLSRDEERRLRDALGEDSEHRVAGA